MSIREIKEGKQEQGIEEEITYTLAVPTSWGTPTGTPTVKGYSTNEVTGAYTDVTSTIFPVGAASVLLQVITLPEMKALTADVLYRVEVKFETSQGDILEAYAWIRATR
jgi:hypothetical protein